MRTGGGGYSELSGSTPKKHYFSVLATLDDFKNKINVENAWKKL